ncbi:toxin [Streptomyces sp. RSD-27]|nr:toxin [Streptomyces sp. RSD-27]
MTDYPELHWFKSSYSDGSEGDSCVEVASTAALIHVRDSKDTALPHLTFGPAAWSEFVSDPAGL